MNNLNEVGFVRYHQRGDAGIEEAVLHRVCDHLNLDEIDRFKLCYFYSMCYNLHGALTIFFDNNVSKKLINFRTDRRWVRIGQNYDKLLIQLDAEFIRSIRSFKDTQTAYDYVSKKFFFGRYATFLLLEAYMAVVETGWKDNLMLTWKPVDLYCQGAMSILGMTKGTYNKQLLQNLMERCKNATNDNAFAIETSLCGWQKMIKGTRWDGFYTERLIMEIEHFKDTRNGKILKQCLTK